MSVSQINQSPDIEVGSDVSSSVTNLQDIKGVTTSINGWEPFIIEKVEITVEGNAEPVTNQCGETEVKKNGDTNWTVAVDGIFTVDNLGTVQNIGRQQRAQVSSTALGSQSGEFIVADLSYNMQKDLVTVQKSNGPKKLALKFQFQFKEEQSPTGGA